MVLAAIQPCVSRMNRVRDVGDVYPLPLWLSGGRLDRVTINMTNLPSTTGYSK
jgi:hypothetical protein